MTRTRKILVSVLLLAVVSVVAGLGTRAFFSDTETSVNNVLQAGAIDLKIDNDSYYNGLRCQLTDRGWIWVNVAQREYRDPYMRSLIGQRCVNSWELRDLGEVERFFDFYDLKPGDWGEDTISLHLEDNPAWLCIDITLTSTPENVAVEPELDDGDTEDDGQWDGELQDELSFVFWVDDGDNVWECDLPRDDNPNPATTLDVDGRLCERPLYRGPISGLPEGEPFRVALADTSFEAPFNRPMLPTEDDDPYYIGKYWCFGDMTPNPVPYGEGESPAFATGFDCDGRDVTNVSQTDSITGDISFEVVQARNNGRFLCNPPVRPLPDGPTDIN